MSAYISTAKRRKSKKKPSQLSSLKPSHTSGANTQLSSCLISLSLSTRDCNQNLMMIIYSSRELKPKADDGRQCFIQ